MLFYLGIRASEPVRAWASAPRGLREIADREFCLQFILFWVCPFEECCLPEEHCVRTDWQLIEDCGSCGSKV